jgi:hypothetical protein
MLLGVCYHYFISVLVQHWIFMKRLLALSYWLNLKTILDMLQLELLFNTNLWPIHLPDILSIIINLVSFLLCFLLCLNHDFLFLIDLINFILIIIWFIRQFLKMLPLFPY